MEPILKNDYAEQRRETEVASEKNFADIGEREPRLHQLGREVGNIVNANASAKSKLGKFYQLAEVIADAVAPSAVCRRHCSACCHIAVAITQLEADRIGEAIGRPAKKIATSGDFSMRDTYFGVPCPFLKEGDCSIYDARPLACRLHFNIGASPFFCDTAILPEDSSVPNVNLETFWMGVVFAAGDLTHADIREFFA